FELFLIMYVYFYIAFEKPFLRLDGQRIDIELQLAGDQVGDLVDDPYVVHADDAYTGEKGYFFILCPFRFDDAVTVIGHQFGGIGAIGAMDSEALPDRYETEDVVAGYRLATIGKGINDAVAAFTEDDQLGILTRHVGRGRFGLPVLYHRFGRFGR